jgi:hypothetical protein
MRTRNTWNRRLLFALVFVCATAAQAGAADDVLDLAGRWRFELDRRDVGRQERWFARELTESLTLPGSLQAQGFGDLPSEHSAWVARIGLSLLEDPRYAPYREPGRFKTPFWLTPERHYVGPAWYQRDIQIPSTWAGRRLVLLLERPHWETQVWIDDRPIGIRNGLGTPHEFDLTEPLSPGSHRLTIRIDNRMVIPVGPDAHSISDQTQTAWNGVAGRIELQATDLVWLDDVQVYPDASRRLVHVVATVGNRTGAAGAAALRVFVESDGPSAQRLPELPIEARWAKDGGRIEFDYELGAGAVLWDEFSPSLYRLKIDGLGTTRTVRFGLRDLGVSGTQFTINGRRIFLRGTLECAVFPLTGYPPTDVASWKRILQVARAHGLNHLRFHSWTPPEAAFVAADEIGFYYQVEVSAWASFGDGTALDSWLDEETARTIRAFGNHPSFLLLAPANEPGGRNSGRFLGDWIQRWTLRDARRRYTAGSGWPIVPENQFHVAIEPRVQGTKEYLLAPETESDYRAFVARFPVPVVSHEVGQWVVYPNFAEIPKYTGTLKAGNLEIFRDFLNKSGMGQQAADFLRASGRFQTVFYKAEIEKALRTPGMGGFQLLDLHDFPGQGTAPVGVLDAFWEEKGYVSPEQYRRFCAETVLVARLAQRVYTSNETFRAAIEVAHFGPRDLPGATLLWRVRRNNGIVLADGRIEARPVPTGFVTPLGRIELPLSNVSSATRLSLEVAIEGTSIANDWDVWVYPRDPEPPVPANVLVAEEMDSNVAARLASGGRVLLLPGPRRITGNTVGSFHPIFWNRVTFVTQREHTLGLWIAAKHAALGGFPTAEHSDWQWWDLAQRSKPMLLDGLPAAVRPIVQPIDDWNLCRRLGLVVEARVGKGRLLLTSIDLQHDLDTRPAARQLRRSLLSYAASPAFEPAVALSVEQVRSLFRPLPIMDRLGARIVRADSETIENGAANLLDADPTSSWATTLAGRSSGFDRPYPHEVVIELREPTRLAGLRCLPRVEPRGRIREYRVELSDDDRVWREVAHGTFDASEREKEVRFAGPETARYLRLVAVSSQGGEAGAALAELEVIEQ